jgi:hypothetical protein
MLGSPAWAEVEINNRLPCPNGACVPNRMTFGYYPTRWRKWPVTTASAGGPTEAARDAIQPPQTSEPPAAVEDEVRSPFERLPKPRAPQGGGEEDLEPLPGGGGLGRDPGDESNDDSGTGGSRRGSGGDQNGGPSPRRPRSPERIFQPPRGNPPPATSRPIEGARLPSDAGEGAPLALERPATLIPPVARPVSYASAMAKPSTKTTKTTAKANSKSSPAKRAAASDNPLRKARAPQNATPAPEATEAGEDEGPQIIPTAAWIEEVASAAEPAVVHSEWRANPLRGR